MSIEQVDANQHTPVQVDDWNELVRYVSKMNNECKFEIICLYFRRNYYPKVRERITKYV
jgi:hypothetical protein